MLTDNKNLKGLIIRATDGEIGSIDQLYFDDQTWAIRYLTAQTGSWLNGRQVLISPHAILQTDWPAGRIDVSLTRQQVERAPDIDTQRPVSRQHEAEYYSYYGYPYDWEGPFLWGPSYYPAGILPLARYPEGSAARIPQTSLDAHLRSTGAVAGYKMHATDGEIGHLDRFIIDDEAWTIRYLEVATKNWWPGKRVLLSPEWVEKISWADEKIFVAVDRKAIQTCPDYLDSVPITRAYENKIYFHYGRPPYWIENAKSAAAYSWSGL